jgi:hypothetical protein
MDTNSNKRRRVCLESSSMGANAIVNEKKNVQNTTIGASLGVHASPMLLGGFLQTCSWCKVKIQGDMYMYGYVFLFFNIHISHVYTISHA